MSRLYPPATSRPPPEARPSRRATELLLFSLGAAAACGVLLGPFGWPAVALAALLATALRIGAASPRRNAARFLPLAALILLAALYIAWIYFAAVLGWLLGWTVAWPLRIGLLVLAGLALLSWRRPLVGVRVPLVLPIGIWISLCSLGWWREDGVIRCDDYDRLRAQTSVTLVIPSTQALASCTAGDVLRLHRYPRRVWEAPDGSGYIVPMQEGINTMQLGASVPDPIDDGVCRFAADGARGACIGGDNFKMQVIFDAERLDRVYVGGWSRGRGVLYALSRQAPLRVVEEIHTDASTGEGYYDEAADEIGLLEDHCSGLTRIRASDLSSLPQVAAPFCPGEAHYDQATHEGILCFAPGPLAPLIDGGEAGYLSVAFHGHPFSFRLLGHAPWSPWTHAALVWGCDFDPAARVAWVPIASLPFTAVIDYDSGRITDTWWTEPGMRSVVFDPTRQRVYMANFLRGEIVAVDAASGRERQRWFVGRFTRYVTLSRDRQALLATSNLGVLRIPLPPAEPGAPRPAPS